MCLQQAISCILHDPDELVSTRIGGQTLIEDPQAGVNAHHTHTWKKITGLAHEGQNMMAEILETTFSNVLGGRKGLFCAYNFTGIYSWILNWQPDV